MPHAAAAAAADRQRSANNTRITPPHTAHPNLPSSLDTFSKRHVGTGGWLIVLSGAFSPWRRQTIQDKRSRPFHYRNNSSPSSPLLFSFFVAAVYALLVLAVCHRMHTVHAGILALGVGVLLQLYVAGVNYATNSPEGYNPVADAKVGRGDVERKVWWRG